MSWCYLEKEICVKKNNNLWFKEFEESKKAQKNIQEVDQNVKIKVALRQTGWKRTASLRGVKPAGPPLQCQPFAHFPVQIANQAPFRPRWPGTGTDRPGMRRSVPRVSNGSPQRRAAEIHTAVFTDAADYHPAGADAPHRHCRD